MQMGVHVHVGLQVPELATQPGGRAHLGQQERPRRATYPGAAQTGVQVIYEASPKSSVQVRPSDGVEALRENADAKLIWGVVDINHRPSRCKIRVLGPRAARFDRPFPSIRDVSCTIRWGPTYDIRSGPADDVRIVQNEFHSVSSLQL